MVTEQALRDIPLEDVSDYFLNREENGFNPVVELLEVTAIDDTAVQEDVIDTLQEGYYAFWYGTKSPAVRPSMTPDGRQVFGEKLETVVEEHAGPLLVPGERCDQEFHPIGYLLSYDAAETLDRSRHWHGWNDFRGVLDQWSSDHGWTTQYENHFVLLPEYRNKGIGQRVAQVSHELLEQDWEEKDCPSLLTETAYWDAESVQETYDPADVFVAPVWFGSDRGTACTIPKKDTEYPTAISHIAGDKLDYHETDVQYDGGRNRVMVRSRPSLRDQTREEMNRIA